MHVRMDKVYFFDPEEYANVAPVENTVESEVQETIETTSTKKNQR